MNWSNKAAMRFRTALDALLFVVASGLKLPGEPEAISEGSVTEIVWADDVDVSPDVMLLAVIVNVAVG